MFLVDKPGFLQARRYKQSGRRHLEVRRSLVITLDDDWYLPVLRALEERIWEVVQVAEYLDPSMMFRTEYTLYKEIWDD